LKDKEVLKFYNMPVLDDMRSVDRVTLWTTLLSGTAWMGLLVTSRHHHALPLSLSGFGGEGVLNESEGVLLTNGLFQAVESGVFHAEIVHWLLMIAAMMLPLLIVPIRQVAFRSYRWRRGKAVGGFIAGYSAVWIITGLFAVVFVGVLAVTGLINAPVTGPIVLLAAAIWQLSPLRGDAMRRCHRSVALTPRGLAADLDCVHFGVFHGLACVTVCFPLMLATMIAIPGMTSAVVLAAVLFFERAYQREYRIVPAAVLIGGSVILALSSHFSLL
jgi:predicted metal-binding membrane protein